MSDHRRALLDTLLALLVFGLFVTLAPAATILTVLSAMSVYFLWENVFVLGGRVNPELPLWQIIAFYYGLPLLVVLVHGGLVFVVYRVVRWITRPLAPTPRICA